MRVRRGAPLNNHCWLLPGCFETCWQTVLTNATAAAGPQRLSARTAGRGSRGVNSTNGSRKMPGIFAGTPSIDGAQGALAARPRSTRSFPCCRPVCLDALACTLARPLQSMSTL